MMTINDKRISLYYLSNKTMMCAVWEHSTSRLDIRRKSPHCHYGEAVSILL